MYMLTSLENIRFFSFLCITGSDLCNNLKTRSNSQSRNKFGYFFKYYGCHMLSFAFQQWYLLSFNSLVCKGFSANFEISFSKKCRFWKQYILLPMKWITRKVILNGLVKIRLCELPEIRSVWAPPDLKFSPYKA